MKKTNILKKSYDFDRIIHSTKPIKSYDYIIYIEYNNDNNYHFGLSVGKKIGNAVTRNKVKRQIKNIIDKNNYKNGFNCIIIVRKGILDKSFNQINDELNISLNKLNIIKEDIQ